MLMMYRWLNGIVIAMIVCGCLAVTVAESQKPARKSEGKAKVTTRTGHKPKIGKVSYAKDVMPIFRRYCLPCHTEDQLNPSELYLDNFADMIKGGKHGPPIISGKADSSAMIRKIGATPPFGDPMPLKRKSPFPLDTLSILKAWIDQGAKDN